MHPIVGGYHLAIEPPTQTGNDKRDAKEMIYFGIATYGTVAILMLHSPLSS
jgi:hypothetical protein